MAQTYNFPDHTKGDTFKGVSFTVLVNTVALSILAVKMELKLAYNTPATLTLSNGYGMTISDTPGVFTVDKQIIDIPAGNYIYDIEITTQSGDIDTYIKGDWSILSGVTNG